MTNGWDRFLTDQDRQHLEIWGKRAPDGFGTRSVLLVVDLFYAALGHERKPLVEYADVIDVAAAARYFASVSDWLGRPGDGASGRLGAA